MMNTSRILNLTRHPELLDRETLYELRNCLSRYPYFTAARILYLHNLYLLREPGFNEELKLAALQVNDRSRLFQVIEGPKYSSISHTAPAGVHRTVMTPPEEGSSGPSRTLDLINQFLSHQPEKEPLVPFDLTVDYTTYLLEGNDQKVTPSPTQDIIDSFLQSPASADESGEEIRKMEEESLRTIQELKKEEEITRTSEETDLSEEIKRTAPEKRNFTNPPATRNTLSKEEPNPLDESFFTETLAKIYIKQGRYDKALEIIKNIYLKNPKKSAYFADQIRFLEKLIINSK